MLKILKIKSETGLLDYLESISEISSLIQKIKRSWAVSQSQNTHLQKENQNSADLPQKNLNQTLKDFCWKLGDSEILTDQESEKVFQYVHKLQTRIQKFKKSRESSNRDNQKLEMILKGHARVIEKKPKIESNKTIERPLVSRDKNLLFTRSKLIKEPNFIKENSKLISNSKNLEMKENVKHTKENQIKKVEVKHMECQTDSPQIPKIKSNTVKRIVCWNCFKSFEFKNQASNQTKVSYFLKLS